MKTVIAIKVTNKKMSIKMFDVLCDKLSELRKYCHDYRIVKDFDISTDNQYWESSTYLDTDTLLINAAYDSVLYDVREFCNKFGVPKSYVSVEVKTYEYE